MLSWFLIAVGCAPNLQPLFEQERAWGLEVASHEPSEWEPEVVIRISQRTMQSLFTAVTDQELAKRRKKTVRGPLGITAKLEPTAELERLELTPAPDACDACLSLKLSGDGEMAWSAAGLRGNVPFELSARAILSVETDGFQVSARIQELQRAAVQVAASPRLKLDPGDATTEWAREILSEQIPSIPLADLSGQDLPLRALRVKAESGGVRLELLTTAAHGRPVQVSGRGPTSGWSAALSQETLLDLARRAAWQHGSVGEDAWAIPSALSLDGEAFQMDLRIWRMVGKGWWRDYRVTGATELTQRGKLKLVPEGAEETDQSQGAGLVDPLALIAEGRILTAIEEGAAQAFPLRKRPKIGALQIEVDPERAAGEGGALLVTGTAEVGE